MDLKELEQYQAICLGIKRLKREMRDMENEKNYCGTVTGSNPEPPYTKRTYTLSEANALIDEKKYTEKKERLRKYFKKKDRIEFFIEKIEDVTIQEALIAKCYYRETWFEISHNLGMSENALKQRIKRFFRKII